MDILQKIAPLFSGWDETLIRSVLEGHMGRALVDDADHPASAQLVIGGFCFFGGRASESLALRAGAMELVPQNTAWSEAIERAWGERAEKHLRYAMKKDPDAFNRTTLQYYVDSLPDGYELRLFDESICEQSQTEEWSRDFYACFHNCGDFMRRGFAAAVLRDGVLVSGAGTYAVYSGGVEVEIDTHPEHRQRGLATACGARFILEALDRSLYPNWDAFDLRSVALAEKLGYRVDHPYTVYMVR